MLAAVLSSALLAGPAWAGDVVDGSAFDPPRLSFADDPGDGTALTVTWDATARTVTFTDTANPITAAPAFCTATPASTVTCTIAAGDPVPRLFLYGNDGADSLTVNGPIRTEIDGGDGPDTIRGGSAIDWVFPRGGDDDVDGRDGGDLIYAAEGGSVNGADRYADTGTTGFDNLTYFFMPDAAGVDITVDGVANDGNTTLDGGADDVGAGFDLIQGSEQADDITGGPAAETISGAGGDDRLDGGGGADTFNGAEGEDTVDARDGAADATIDCDNSLGTKGTADVAAIDADDPEPSNCETVNRAGAAGGGGGGGGGSGGGSTSPGTSVPTPGAPGATVPAGQGATLIAATTTREAATMPGVVGRNIEAARKAVAGQVDAMDLDVVFQRGCKASQDLEVLRQRPAKGARLDVAAGRPVPVRLTICIAERDFLADCDLKDLRNDLKELPRRMDADAGASILDRFGRCKVDYDVKLAKRAEEARIALEAQKAKAAADKKQADERAKRQKKAEIRSAITCPTAPEDQDLTMTLTEGAVADQQAYALKASGPGGWTIPAGRTSYVDVLVRDKGLPAHAVEARVYQDGDDVGVKGSDLGAPKQSAQSVIAKDGYVRLILSPRKAGTIPICAVLRTGDGAMTAATAVRVVEEPKVGDVWTTISGRQLKTTKNGVVPVLAKGAAAHQNPVSAVVDFLVGLFSGASRTIAALGGGGKETTVGASKLRSIQQSWAAAQVSLDGALVSDPQPPKIVDGPCLGWIKDAVLALRCEQLQAVDGNALLGMSTTGGRIVAAGGGNVLSHNGSQIISRDSAGIVETNGFSVASSGLSNPGKGLMVAAGGLNAIGPAAAQLVGNDGASLIGNDGSTLIGNDGSTLIGNDGSTLIGNDGSTLQLAGPAGLVPKGSLP